MRFNVLLAATVVAGLVWPDGGLALVPFRKALIVAVMFLMAVTLPGERLRRAATAVRGLAACGAVGYVFLPAACVATGWLLFGDSPGLLAGMAVLGALPSTLASGAVWTRLAGGDDALALVYTVASNAASVLLAPAILFVALSRRFELPVDEMFVGLCLVVLVPVALGQASRRLLGGRADRMKTTINTIAKGLVLGVVLMAVASMAGEIRARPWVVGALAAIGGTLHVAALVLAGWLGRVAGLGRDTRTAVLFSGSQKTLFIGVYLAQEYFPGEVLALLPITAYHVVQLVVDTVVAGRIASAGEGAADP